MKHHPKFYGCLLTFLLFAFIPSSQAQESLSIRTAHLEEDQPLHSFKVEYPELTHWKNPKRQQQFNKKIGTLIGGRLISFRRIAKNWAQESKRLSPTNRKTSFWVSYQVLNDHAPVLSILFNGSTFLAGATRPRENFITVNFNLKTGKEISLKDIFKKKVFYLQLLSEIAQTQLMKGMNSGADPNLITLGTGPTPRNFQNFNITPKGLLIQFEPNQVAPYQAGPQQVLVPYDMVWNALRPKFIKLISKPNL